MLMHRSPVIAVFDIGKTNKKIILFDQSYRVVAQQNEQLEETVDEDGYPCEDIRALSLWIHQKLDWAQGLGSVRVRCANFSAYGASLVPVNKLCQPVGLLYNYLKPLDETLRNSFYAKYGGQEEFSRATASPVLGNLNSGLQIYRLKNEKPELFSKADYFLHLPQYLSSILTTTPFSELTSIGSHTALWNFDTGRYHQWVTGETVLEKLAPLTDSGHVCPVRWADHQLSSGIGLHDSSAALIPYLLFDKEPFVLLSTGTWSISLNPFNHETLTQKELNQDCLCYLDFKGKPVKASRIFSGHDHQQQVKRLSGHFLVQEERFRTVQYNPEILSGIPAASSGVPDPGLSKGLPNDCGFGKKELSDYSDYDAAYHGLIQDLITQQVCSTNLAIGHSKPKHLYVDGGFSRNELFMNMLAAQYPDCKVYAAELAQASALGAALAVHQAWNDAPVPANLICPKRYPAGNLD